MKTGTQPPFKQGSMHGVELGRFTCKSGFERVIHRTSVHTLIIASGSLADEQGMPREGLTGMTIRFNKLAEVRGGRPIRRCPGCKLVKGMDCILPT